MIIISEQMSVTAGMGFRCALRSVATFLPFLLCSAERKPSLYTVPCQVRFSTNDDSTCEAIVNKLGSFSGISFATVAKAAYSYGKPALAIRVCCVSGEIDSD